MSYELRLLLTAAICAAACAIPGVFLVTRRMSLLGDALSHAVLPGVVAAFLFSGSRATLPMLAGAAAVGVFTAWLTEWVRGRGKVESSAALGVVFTSLFALGLLLVKTVGGQVDLDLDCVLFGSLEAETMHTQSVFGLALPRALVIGAGMLLFNLAAVAVFFKELRLTSFDPALAATLGFRPRLMHAALCAVTAVTSVACFRAVGSVLVLAMLVLPAATALLLTRRLGWVLILALIIALLSAPLGLVLAHRVPPLLPFPGHTFQGTVTAPSMAVAGGLLLVLAVVFSPQQGLLLRALSRRALTRRVEDEDALAALWRAQESGRPVPALASAVLQRLLRAGLLARVGAEAQLTAAGLNKAAQLVRSHRLWETYLDRETALPQDHLHLSAHRLEHATEPALAQALADALGDAANDPHGKPIPPKE